MHCPLLCRPFRLTFDANRNLQYHMVAYFGCLALLAIGRFVENALRRGCAVFSRKGVILSLYRGDCVQNGVRSNFSVHGRDNWRVVRIQNVLMGTVEIETHQQCDYFW